MHGRINRIKRKRSRRKVIIRNRIIFILIAVALLIIVGVIYNESITENSNSEQSSRTKEDEIVIEEDVKEETPKEQVIEVTKEQIIISAAGDCTFGTDTKFSESDSFQAEFKKNGEDYSHFMKNVAPIFREDDYTLVNLETTFTSSTVKADKGTGTVYHFKGPKEYVNILSTSSIEGVTIDNNHIYDYGQQGLDDTINTLIESNIDYCGKENKIIREVKGIKIGILGYSSFGVSDELKTNIKNEIDELKSEGCNIVITYFHWGSELEYKPNKAQIEMARFAIDSGSDMVLGSHPHVMQTIEKYNGKLIAYSLGNFSFGGNSNPEDKRTFIIQGKFSLEDKVLKGMEFKVIPTIISSVNNKNDYVPTPATGESATEIIRKLNELSPTLEDKIGLEFFSF